jgi:ribonuclease J
VTDRTHLVHVSGHPRRDEMTAMYAWTRPRIAVPAHGEALHLAEHAAFATAQGVPEVVRARNGAVVRLAPGPAEIVDHVQVGRLYRDGDVVIDSEERAIPERRKLAESGIVSACIAIDARGELAGEPAVALMGLPERGRGGEVIIDLVAGTIDRALSGLSPKKRRDSEAVENAVERSVRSAVAQAWGKKPACHVLVVEV